MMPLPLSPLMNQGLETSFEPILQEKAFTSDQNGHCKKLYKLENGTPNHIATKQVASTCLIDGLEASERKDSVIDEHKNPAKRHTHDCHTGEGNRKKLILHSKGSNSMPQCIAERQNKLHENGSCPGTASHLTFPDVYREPVIKTPIAAVTKADFESIDTSRPNTLLSRSVSERKVETMSRTRRIWNLFMRNNLKRSKSIF